MKSIKKNKLYGLIGQTLSHSFSKDFFLEKFNKENLNCSNLLYAQSTR